MLFWKFLLLLIFLFLLKRSFQGVFRCCSYGGKLAPLGGLARLGEMIFIPRSYGIFYLSSIKKFVMSLKKIVWSSSKQWLKAIMQNKCSYKLYYLKKTLSRLAGLAHLRVFIWKIFISAKSCEISPRRTGSSYERIILRKARSHLGELARLTEPAQLHMNSPTVVLKFLLKVPTFNENVLICVITVTMFYPHF